MLLLSRLKLDSLSLDEAQRLVHSSINWKYFESLTINHSVAPLISKHLVTLKGVPDKTLTILRATYHHTLQSNILNITETEKVVQGLLKTGIKAIPLKGSTSSEKIFGDIGIYPASDIDILVMPGDIDKARDFLEKNNYKLIDHDFDRYRKYYLKEQYHITFAKGKHAIELHWNLLMRFFSAPPEFWWTDLRRTSTNSVKTFHLSPEKELLYLSFRLFSKGFCSLKHLLLFAETLNYYADDVNWEKMISHARSFHMKRVFIFTCFMAHELLKTPIDKNLLALDNEKEKRRYRYALKLLFQEKEPSAINKVPLIFMRDDFKGAFFVLLKRLFPSAGEVSKRYQLKSGTPSFIFHYLANPLILMRDKHKKGQK